MKKFLRTVLAGTLAILARAVLRKYKPKVVMVTGSVGKTSTKDAVSAVLNEYSYIWASKKNFNSEFGVPLTIFGMSDRWSGLKDWIPVIGEAIILILFPNHYPKILVLEVGADSPGDLNRILNIATPDVVVVTRLPEMPVHVEAYATPDAVREEEFSPAYALAPGSPLIVCADDSFACALAAPLSVQLFTYGMSPSADIRIASDTLNIVDDVIVGMKAEVTVDNSTLPITVQGVVGRPQLLAPAAAIALARALSISTTDAIKGLESYKPPAGRGRLIRGLYDSLILDDSYNASPAAVREALVSISLIQESGTATRTIAALGDMLELGRYSQAEHEAIGKEAATSVDVLVAVGIRSREMARAAKEVGMSKDNIYTFDTSNEAAPFLKEFIQSGDAILIKGSQSMRMERIAEVLVNNPLDMSQLVRQDRVWK